MSATNLRSVGEEQRLLVVQLDGLGVQVNCGGVIAVAKGLVALVLEVDSLLRHVDGIYRSPAGGEGVKQRGNDDRRGGSSVAEKLVMLRRTSLQLLEAVAKGGLVPRDRANAS